MDNLLPSEVIKIDASCLKDIKIEKDMEWSFRYFNSHFMIMTFILMILFGFQLYAWLPSGEDIDMGNFTYKFSNYSSWGNSFWIITSIFLHGGFYHIFSNILFLYPFTLITSSIIPFHTYISVIFFTGILSSKASWVLNTVPSLWASGWIFGIFWFLVPYYLYNKAYLSSNVQDIPWVFLCMSVYMIWNGLSDPMVDNVAHIVGFISGILYGFIYFRYYYKK
jgi:rhomboid protease GluP